MKLRFATQADVPRLVEVGRAAHAESRFASMPYDTEKLLASLGGLVDLQRHGNHFFLLAESRESHVIGMLIGSIEEYFFTHAKCANSILLWVSPKYRGSAAALRLIGAFRDWGLKQGALEVCINVASGVTIGRTDRFLRRLGFLQTGGNYAMSSAVSPL